MAALLRVGVRDLSRYLRVQPDDGLDPADARRLEPIFAGVPALSDGQVWIGDATTNREWKVPLFLKSRPPLTQYTDLLTNPSFETNTTSWAADSGGTLTRITSDALVGSACLEVVNTADNFGRVSAPGTGVAVVAAGQTLYVRCGIKIVSISAGAITNIALSIRWLDSTGATISQTSVDQVNSPTTGLWYDLDGAAVAPAQAASALILPSYTADTASNITWRVDRALMCITADTPGYFDGDSPGSAWTGASHGSTSTSNTGPINLVANPSFETGTTGWAAQGAGSTISQDTTKSKSGAASLKVVQDGSGSSRGATYAVPSTSCICGQSTYTAGVWVYGEQGVGNTLQLRLRELDSSGATIGDTSQTFTLQAGWQRVTVSRAFGATGVGASIFVLNSGGVPYTVYLDGALLVRSAADTEYFDGDSLDAEWSGTRHASPSVALAGADGVLEMVRNLKSELSQGQQVEFRPDGISQSTFFDLERGQFNEEYNHFRLAKGWQGGLLELWTRPHGHTGTSRVVASALSTGPIELLATGILGDQNADVNLRMRVGSYFNSKGLVVWGVAPHASWGFVHPAASFSNPGGAAASLVGASGAYASQYMEYVGANPITAGADLCTDVPAIPSIYAGQRIRLLGVVKHNLFPASAAIFRSVQIIGGAAVGIATANATAGNEWQLVDLGEFTPPGGDPKDPPIPSFGVKLQGFAASGASLVATWPFHVNYLIYLPVESGVGILSGQSLATQPRGWVDIDTVPNRVYEGATLYVRDLMAGYRGVPPKLPPVGSAVATCSKVFAAAGPVDRFAANDVLDVQVSAREKFSFFR